MIRGPGRRPELRQPTGAARDRPHDRARRDVRAHRARRRRQDDVVPDRRGPSRADLRHASDRGGRRVRLRPAALLAVRGPHRRREPRAEGPPLLRAADDVGAARARGPPGARRPRPLRRAPRGSALGRHEAEALARLGAHDAARRSSSSTSRRRASTPSRAASSGCSSTAFHHEGLTIVVSTPYMDEAEYATRLAFLDAGASSPSARARRSSRRTRAPLVEIRSSNAVRGQRNAPRRAWTRSTTSRSSGRGCT